jgi:hypothetical protein
VGLCWRHGQFHSHGFDVPLQQYVGLLADNAVVIFRLGFVSEQIASMRRERQMIVFRFSGIL